MERSQDIEVRRHAETYEDPGTHRVSGCSAAGLRQAVDMVEEYAAEMYVLQVVGSRIHSLYE